MSALAWWFFGSAVFGTAVAALQEQEPQMASAPVRAAVFAVGMFVMPLVAPLFWLAALIDDKYQERLP